MNKTGPEYDVVGARAIFFPQQKWCDTFKTISCKGLATSVTNALSNQISEY